MTAPRRVRSVLQVASTGNRVGVSGVVSLLARALAERGIATGVLALNGGPLVDEMRAYGLPAFALAAPRPMDPGAVFRMRALLANGSWDVIHTHGQRAMFVGNLAARLERARAIVSSFHEMAAVKATTSRWFRLYYTGERVLARFCTDACVATSRPVAEDALAVRKVPRAKLVTIHNAVDREKFHPAADRSAVADFRTRLGLAPGDRVIGCLGSMVPIKGHRWLVEALPAVRARVPEARVVIAGEGPLRDELLATAAALGIAEHVRLPGVVAATNLFYNALDVLALPSLSESCPLVVLEAIACGVPVVASAVGGVPDLVRAGETGLLVPPHDPAALADALARALEDRGASARRAAAASAFVDAHYSATLLVDRHVTLYERLLAGQPPRG